MYETIRDFYNSRAWRRCRDGYRKQARGLCERCLKRGIVRAGDEVHHKIKLTTANINQPEISLNYDNLELLCQECHHAEHDKHHARRYTVDKFGRVTAK